MFKFLVVYIGIIYGGYVGIMEDKMDTAIW